MYTVHWEGWLDNWTQARQIRIKSVKVPQTITKKGQMITTGSGPDISPK